MIAPFDIFKVEAPGRVLWLEAQQEFEVAKARVRNLMVTSPAEYVIYSQRTGNKVSFKPNDRYLLGKV